MASKEQLVSQLRSIIETTHQADGNVMGAALFGSRTKPKWPFFGPGKNSDVDLAFIYSRFSPDSEYSLVTAVHYSLISRGLIGDFHGNIYVDQLNRALAGTAERFELLHLEVICSFFDKRTEILTMDERIEDMIRRFASGFDKRSLAQKCAALTVGEQRRLLEFHESG